MPSHNLPAERRDTRGMTTFDMLQDRIDRMFEDFSSGLMPFSENGFGRGLMPSIDVHDAGGKITVNAELPGVDEKDIEITADDDLLVISGEKRSEIDEKMAGGSYRTERSYGRFSRSIRMPFAVDPKRVQARFDRGVLKLTVERPADAQARAKKIPISH